MLDLSHTIAASRMSLGGRIILLMLLPALIGAAFNGLRHQPLPWRASEAYPILRDCPEVTTTASVVAAAEALHRSGRLVLVDASAPATYRRAHVRGALSVPYDPLLPVSDAALKSVRAAGATWLLVYGAGGTGHALADELASAGVAGVLWVEGDLPALQSAGAPVDTGEDTP